MNYQQEYIRDEYLELRMPAGMGDNGEPTFLLDPNHLHIWPRHSFMLIALPNKVNIPTHVVPFSFFFFPLYFRRCYINELFLSFGRIKHLHALYLHRPPSLIASVPPTVYLLGFNPNSRTLPVLLAKKHSSKISRGIPEVH